MATDAEYREKVAGRPLRSATRFLNDGELLARLRSFGIELDRSSLCSLCDEYLSAEEMARPLIAKQVFKTRKEELEGDWIWVCLEALWRRWFPDEPSFEMLDDKIQAGYELENPGNGEAACRIWMEAWDDAMYLFDKGGIETLDEFDDRFMGTQSLFNWVQELEMQLWNAGLKDRRFLTDRIELCEEMLERFGEDDDPSPENCRRALAESYFNLGETGKADDLFREWLKIDPQWGWGWIAWSDCYRFTITEYGDLHRAEELLREGLSIAGVRDFRDIADRLADLFDDQGRGDEAKEIRRQAEMRAPEVRETTEAAPAPMVTQQETINIFGDSGLPLGAPPKRAKPSRASTAPVAGGRQKVGRNDPCPCGSGQKFKNCCA